MQWAPGSIRYILHTKKVEVGEGSGKKSTNTGWLLYGMDETNYRLGRTSW